MALINIFGLLDLSLRNSILLTVFLAGVIYYNFKRWKMYVLASKLEGPNAFPIFGSAHHLLGLDTEGFTTSILGFCKQYKSPVRFWLGTNLILFISGPEDLQDILTSQNCLDKDEFYKIINNISYTKNTMTSLVTSPASVWRPNRKLLNPSFSTSILKSFLPIYNEESKTMVDLMAKNVGKGAFDLYRYSAGCSLDMICRSSMGIEMHIQRDQNYSFIDAFDVIFEIIFERIYKLYLRPNSIFKLSKYAKTWNRYTKDLYIFEAEVLQKMIEKLEEGDEKDELEKHNNIFLRQLFKAKNDGIFSMDDILGEVSTLLLAGNDTSATAVAFAILSLAIHPEIQDRVYAEIMDVIPGADHEVTADDFQNLPYIDMVIKETLRVFPVVPFIARTVSSDMKVGDKIVPAGVGILIAIYATHHDKRIWGPDADKFNPDNFLPENVKKRHPFSYIPFSGGPRICIGMKQGTFTVKTMLIHLLKAYKFSTDLKMESLQLKTNITIKLIGGQMVKIERRV